MARKHRVIPIFIPEKACPHRCVYCNQYAIAGQPHVPTPEEAHHIIEQHLATIPEEAEKRIAFFGGSFTGMPIAEQNAYLEVVRPYWESGAVSGIQLSTRPDYITPEILDNLKSQGVVLIELGAQSLDNEVLRQAGRGHTAQQVEEASALIRQYGFQLGLQMMIGLPGDTLEKSLYTARRILELGAGCTRIYPTLVVENTALARQYRDGRYQPLSIEKAVAWTKELYRFFTENGIQILRIGLHPSEGLMSGRDYIAGPFHVSFKELVLTALWYDRIEELAIKHQGEPFTLEVSPEEINYAIGYESANRKAFPDVHITLRKG